MSTPIEPNRFEGPVRITVQLDALHAKDNPELFGKAEYMLSFKLGGLERWRSPKPLRVGEGGTVPVGAEASIELDGDTDYVDVAVFASEQDLLSADDQARGQVRLYRSASFDSSRGFVVPIEGQGMDIELRCSVKLEAL